MKIQTLMAVGIFLIGSSVSLAETLPVTHYDMMQDELWHGAETTPTPTTSLSGNVSVNDSSMDHYDVAQDELWHGAETASAPTTTPSSNTSVKHYDVMEDEFWHGS